jgi:hypothetical protein
VNAIANWVKFLWNWLVLRTWVYFFPPKNDGGDEGKDG